jgi:hypothetical protein
VWAHIINGQVKMAATLNKVVRLKLGAGAAKPGMCLCVWFCDFG